MTTQLESDHGALDCPIAWPRSGESRPPYRDEQLGAWVVSRYADVDGVVRDAETFSSQWVVGPDRAAAFAPLMAKLAGDPRAEVAMTFFQIPLLSSDGDVHARERSFVAKAFTPKRVKEYESTIASLCAQLTEELAGRTEVAFVREFAVPLPAQVIAHGLGIPPEDYLSFKRWSDGLMGLIGSPEPTDEQLEAFLTAAVEFTAYISPLIEQRRVAPESDIVSALAGENEAGERLSTREIISMCAALLIAGNETTTSSLGGTMLYLARAPGLQDRVRSDPALIPALVEEGLRLSCPVQALFRTATADAEVAGVRIPAGDHLYLYYAAANRDGAQFAEPLLPRLDREDKRHLTFGRGVHVCPGAPLARTETRIALETLLANTSGISLSDREDAVIAHGNQMTAMVGELYLDVRR
jgi:cytochrome P450